MKCLPIDRALTHTSKYMSFFSNLQKKPRETRVKITWIAAGSVLTIVALLWIMFFLKYEIDDISTDDFASKEITQESKSTIAEIGNFVSTYKEEKKNLQESMEETTNETKTDLEETSQIKNNVEATSSVIEETSDKANISLRLKNFSDKKISLKKFVTVQGNKEIPSEIEQWIEPYGEKNLEIEFPKSSEEKIERFEIREVSSEGGEEQWSYGFDI
ncbi:MAG: hypothetical protein ACD_63C00153G0002 [uncultured bacterium]|nr:MAG: hypothetical protein ACD_63C00153G0002 [uncultured bacterium]